MTIEEYNKKKQDIYGRLSSGNVSQDDAAKEISILIGQHPEGKGLADFTQFLQQFPALGQSMARLQAQNQAGQLQGKIATGLQVLADLGMTAASLNQISVANQAYKGLQKPELAAVSGYNPQLTQALYEAQRGVVNPNAVLDPAKQQIQQGYANALQNNQMASGGQAGSLQAMNQVANLQRMQASLGLAPLAQDIKMQNQGNYNQLQSMRLGETQNMFQNRAGNTDAAWDRYRFGAQAAGMAGSSGRTNLMDATQRLAQHLGNYPLMPNSPQEYQAFTTAQQSAPEFIKSPPFDDSHNDFLRKSYAEAALRTIKGH